MEQWLEIFRLLLQLGFGGAALGCSLIGLWMILKSQERQAKVLSDAITSLGTVVAGLRDAVTGFGVKVAEWDAFQRGRNAGSGTRRPTDSGGHP